MGLKKEKTDKKARIIDEKTPLMFLAGPMFLEMLLNIFINNIDTLMLSHHSELAVGAVGNANQVMMLLIIMFNILATATSVVVAQYLGAKQYDKMNMIYALAFVVNLVMGIVFSVAFVLAKRPLMNLIHVSPEMMPDALTYINIVGGTLFLQACFNVMIQILRCNGHTKIGLYISIAINFVNIVGNYLFLYGPLSFLNLGVAGVAIATATSRLVAIVAAMIYFYYKKIGSIAIRHIIPFPGKMLAKMIRIGIPSAGENLSYNMYQVVLLSFINSMGNDAVSAKVFTGTLMSFAMVFGNSAGMATQIIVGHLVGAGKEDAAYHRVFDTLKVSLPITIGMSLLNVLICRYTLRIFTSNDAVIQLGFYILMVDVVVEFGRCMNITLVNSLKAAGDYIYPMYVSLISMWGVGLTVGYGMGVAAGIGVAGIFMGTASDEFLRAMIFLYRWKKKKWLGKSVVKKA